MVGHSKPRVCRHLRRCSKLGIQNIDGEQSGVLVTTDAGVVCFERRFDGRLVKTIRPSIGKPLILSNQSDAPLRLAIPTGRGYIDVLGPAVLPLVWDLECP